MRVWLELNQEEGEKLFEALKGFTVDRLKTAVMNVPNEKDGTSAVEDTQKEESDNPPVKADKTVDAPKVTREMIRALLTEKKLQGKVLKGLFARFDASNLSGVKEEDYPALLKEAEAV